MGMVAGQTRSSSTSSSYSAHRFTKRAAQAACGMRASVSWTRASRRQVDHGQVAGTMRLMTVGRVAEGD